MPIPSSAMPRTSRLIARRRLEEIEAEERAGVPRGADLAAEKAALAAAVGRKWRINLWLLLIALLVIAALTAIIRAMVEADGVWWLFQIPPVPPVSGDFNTLLAPLLAVAVAIERLLETAFDWYEQSVKAVSDVVAAARKPLDWIEEELKQAYDAAAEAAKKTGVVASEASLKALDLAEERLAKAEQRLLGWVKAPEYVAWKRAICIWVGLLVGLEVSVVGDMGMLHMIGVPCPRLLDMLITGLVVGAGPGPMHSVIGMLQAGKDALDKVAELAQGKALREASASLRERSGV